MRNLPRSYSFWIVILFFVFALLASGSSSLLIGESVRISVNNAHYTTFNFQELEQLAYPIPTNKVFTYINTTTDTVSSQSQQRGITLDELFPVMVEAWELQVERADGTSYSIRSPELAEELPYHVLMLENLKSIGRNGATLSLNVIGEISEEDLIEIWIGWEGVPELKKEISRFADLHGVTIKSLEVPKISSKLIQTQQAGGTLPDVVMVQSDSIFELMQVDSIQPIDYISHHQYTPQGVRSFNLLNRQWAIPFYYDSQVLICNTEIMEQVGIIPETIVTLSDLERAGEAIKEMLTVEKTSSKIGAPIAPLSWNLYSAYWLLPFQYGFGKENLIENNGGVRVNDPSTKAALDYLLSLIDRGILSINERDAMLANFVSGRSGIIFSASYMIPELERLGFPFQIIPLPINEANEKQIAPILDYKGFAITKRSKNPILARRLIQYLCGIGVQQRFPLIMSKLPAWDIAFDQNNPYNTNQLIVKNGSKGGYEIPPDFSYRIYKNVMWNMIRLIFNRKLSVEEGLSEAQRIINIQIRDQLDRLPKDITYVNTMGGRESETEKDTPLVTDSNPSSDDNVDNGFINWLRKRW